jgi:hypothetical protein
LDLLCKGKLAWSRRGSRKGYEMRKHLACRFNLLMRELILPLAYKQRGFDHSLT